LSYGCQQFHTQYCKGRCPETSQASAGSEWRGAGKLGNADFQASELSGAKFMRCSLNDVQFSQAQLADADLRTSTIERIHVGIAELAGVIVDPFQASYLASLMGLVIKHEDEP
jgi:fluoroquinolone resistance protein